MKINYNKSACLGCGNCTEIESSVFTAKGKKIAVPTGHVEDVVTGFNAKLVKNAVSQCPTGAITIAK